MRFFPLELALPTHDWLQQDAIDDFDDVAPPLPPVLPHHPEDMTPRRWRVLQNAWINEQIKSGKLTAETLAELPHAVTNLLSNPGVQRLIDKACFTLEEVMRLTFANCAALGEACVQELMEVGALRLKDLTRMNWAGCEALAEPGVCALLADRLINVHVFFTMSRTASVALCHPEVQQLLRDDLIEVEQILRLTVMEGMALCNHQNIQAYRAGLISLQRLLHPQVTAIALNPSQSTHQRSVHRSVTETALRLKERYRLKLSGKGFKNAIRELTTWVQSLPDADPIYAAAKRGFDYVLNSLVYLDPGSDVSICQLMALLFFAMHDDSLRVSTLEQAQHQFVLALYELRREYNLSEAGFDTGGDDLPSCPGGAFHKLLEKMQGVHPDVQLRFVNSTTAGYKLLEVVREVLTEYLWQSVRCIQLAPQALAFTQQMITLQQEGLASVWLHLQPTIQQRMLDDFSDLYRDAKDPALLSMVESGQGAELKDWKVFQKPLKESSGYQRYLKNVVHHSRGLLPSTPKRRVLSSHEKVQLQQQAKAIYATTRKPKL